MLQKLENFGRQLGEGLAHGWREMKNLSMSALTRFTRKAGSAKGELVPANAPSWSFSQATWATWAKRLS